VTAPITGTSSATSSLPLSSSSGSSSSSSSSSSSTNPLAGLNDTLNQNDFMTLLVAQMTHQDPTAPTDDTAMASELAQFASLSQLTAINTTLTGQSSSTGDLTTSIDNSAALNLIGKTVTAQSSQIAVGTDATTSVSTTVPSTGGDLVLTITDSNGNTVGTKDLGQVAPGTQSVQLAGLTNGLSSGAYNVQFTLTDSSGNATNPPAMITATIDGVTFGSSGAEATSGPLTIPIGSIASVTSN
jgi:flagellar basal-body rod modification protein FlgD